MKYLIVLCCVVAAVIAEEKYTDRYDNTDVKELLKNPRLLAAAVDCMDDKGPCSADIKELKSHLQEALENGCAKCTEAQRQKTPEAIKYLIESHPEIWKKATDKYDPMGIYAKKYEEEAKKHGIKLP